MIAKDFERFQNSKRTLKISITYPGFEPGPPADMKNYTKIVTDALPTTLTDLALILVQKQNMWWQNI
jgi:hypothetical protein